MQRTYSPQTGLAPGEVPYDDRGSVIGSSAIMRDSGRQADAPATMDWASRWHLPVEDLRRWVAWSAAERLWGPLLFTRWRYRIHIQRAACRPWNRSSL